MRDPVASVIRRLSESDRYRELPPHLFPYLVPGLAETLERLEPGRRRLFREQTVADLQRTVKPKKIEQHQFCPLCGHDGFRLMYRPQRETYDGRPYKYKAGRCADCQLLYRVPGIKPSRVPDLYTDGSYGEFLQWKTTGGPKYIRTMEAFGKPLTDGRGRRSLDFGCGTGEAMHVARRHGFDVWGIDLAADAVAIANERLGEHRAFSGDVLDVPELAEGGFDVITLWSVLAHFADPLPQLEALRSLLKPGGMLVIYTVNAQALELKTYTHQWKCFDENHLMFWEPDTLSLLLRKVGFDGVAFRPFYPASIELDRWKFSAEHRQRVIDLTDRHHNGNMLRAVAINGPAETAGVAGTIRL